MNNPSITIIGAGLQGSSIALALSKRGFAVTLLESKAEPLLGASLRNEGKIHLGFVYALDGDGSTRKIMLEGALSFGSLIESWCGNVPWEEWRSENFNYLVMPDSLITSKQLEYSYQDISKSIANLESASTRKIYLGRPLSWVWRKSREVNLMGETIRGDIFETEEVSIDPCRFSEFIAQKVKGDRNISFHGGVTVRSAQRRGCGFELEIIENGSISKILSDIVINCSWEDRLRLDKTVGIEPYPPECSYRIKYQILLKPKDYSKVRAVTMVQGPYGDIVPWKDGTVYLSWYPKSCTYFSALPPDYDYESKASKVAEESLDAISKLFPLLSDSEIISSLPGIIVAHGQSDVDQIDSDLHKRNIIGPRAYDGWWSVDTGKLTTAPYFAEQTAEWIEREIK